MTTLYLIFADCTKYFLHYKLSKIEMVTASSLFLSSSSVRVIVINQNCQKTGQFLADPQFFKADTPFFAIFFAAGLFLPYLICIFTLPVM